MQFASRFLFYNDDEEGIMVSNEEQHEIEAEFIASWDGIELFYNPDAFVNRWTWMRNIHPLIKSFRARGYDRHLRAGTSLFRMMLSRSREYGLRRSQPFLAFDMLEGDGMIVTFVTEGNRIEFVTDRVEITPEIENLLIPLLAYPID
jgi:hypothetical protein